MNQSTEQEWQFASDDLGAARQWLASRSHSSSERRFESQPTLELDDTYYDSADWMIFRAGFALRLRRERANDAGGERTEITLKSLRAARGSLAVRSEFTERVSATDLAGVLDNRDGIAERIRELVGTRALVPLFHAHTRRERQRLLEADNELPLAEIDLDETSIESPGGARKLTRVEVECINAVPAAVLPMVDELRTAAHLQPVDGSKFRAGLSAAGLDPTAPRALGNLEISARQPFASTQLALLRRYFATVLDREPLVRAGSATAVHEMRVAARHLDVMLRLFQGLGPAWIRESRNSVRTLVKALGDVRDCDVQLEFLDRKLPDLDREERAAVEPIREGISGQRLGARARLLRTLDSEAIRRWTETWIAQLGAPEMHDASAQASTASVAQLVIRTAARKVRRRGEKIDDESSPEDYHRLRIRAKRLRYALDAFDGLYGTAARDYARVLAKLQAVLGDFHDVSVRAGNFTALASRGPNLPASTSFMVGRLVERDVRAFDRCRRKFPKAFKRITRKCWRALATAMRAQAQTPSSK